MSKDEVVRRLFAARTVREIEVLAERLGAIGDDAAIDAVRPLVLDPRTRAPAAIVAAFGEIGTDHAVDVLGELVASPRDGIRVAAVNALGRTRNHRAEPVLVEVAKRASDTAQLEAIAALGRVATERGVEALALVASRPDEAGTHAMRVLARIDSPAARAAIVKLVDAPSIEVSAAAIRELGPADIDAALVAKLAQLVASGDRELATAALGALAKAPGVGFPILRDTALQAPIEIRIAAMEALAELGGPEAVATLRAIVESEAGRPAREAARLLGTIDSDEAREALIAAALADDMGEGAALAALMSQHGPEVEQALLVIARSESDDRWDVIEHLVRAGNADALAIAVAEARDGDLERRIDAIEALAGAGTDAAVDAVVELVKRGGPERRRALASLADKRADHPAVARLLAEAVRSNDPEEASEAATLLAGVGTAAARDALVAALASDHFTVVTNAVDSLARFRLTDEAIAALRHTVTKHRSLATEVIPQLLAAGARDGIELARQVLSHGARDEAGVTIEALGQVGTPAAIELLVESTRAAEPRVRAKALSALAERSHPRALELAAQALGDRERGVRFAAADVLATMRTPRARELLVTMTRSADEGDRHVAVGYLSQFGDPTSTRRLAELVRDPDPDVARAAIVAVTDRPDALPTLRGFLSDPAAPLELRRRAATALASRGISDPRIDELLQTDPAEGPYAGWGGLAHGGVSHVPDEASLDLGDDEESDDEEDEGPDDASGD